MNQESSAPGPVTPPPPPPTPQHPSGTRLAYCPYPDNWPLTVNDYREMMQRHGRVKTHVPLFWSQNCKNGLVDEMKAWYQTNVIDGCSRTDVRARSKLLELFGEGPTPGLPRPATCCVETINVKEIHDHVDYAKHYKMNKQFLDHYEKTVFSADGGRRLNWQNSKGLRISQAYAESAVGPTALLFTRPEIKGRNPSRNTAWGGAELGALMRNESIKQIYQVDFKKPLEWDLETGELKHPVLIWDREKDGVMDGFEPRGHMWAFGEWKDRIYEECEIMDSHLRTREELRLQKYIWGEAAYRATIRDKESRPLPLYERLQRDRDAVWGLTSEPPVVRPLPKADAVASTLTVPSGVAEIMACLSLEPR
ncbi:hypothetical protein QBC37DRAFT_457965 [Rhypophila decipiens]|uniref:Uncharacterized protein n=1 Tax=Rhypophila decipiens TaxID=261697 RepID=A0AAN6YB36_9PEZI|nr:hypothetical protein QBC37DRAFT_457965 [Rhypophila decipiens]